MPHPFRTLVTRSRSISALSALILCITVAPAAHAATPPVTRSLELGETRAISVAAMRPGIERAILRMMNCIRTGGTLRSDGTCTGYGTGANGGYRAPYLLSVAASDRVARPYAKLLVSLKECNHWFDGSPSDRLRRGGIEFSNYGENIGCRDGSVARDSVLASHLNFQSEKSYNGWHWRNIKEPSLTHVGIGFWQVGTTIRFTVDFFRP